MLSTREGATSQLQDAAKVQLIQVMAISQVRKVQFKRQGGGVYHNVFTSMLIFGLIQCISVPWDPDRQCCASVQLAPDVLRKL